MSLRKQFEEEVKAKTKGIGFLFETSNNKYIEWLEVKLIKETCSCTHPLLECIENDDTTVICIRCGLHESKEI